MSSREIAEITGKEHKNVLADVRNMLEQLGGRSAEFSAQYRDRTGHSLVMFNLPKDLTITLVSGCSVVMRHRIVIRWMELEAHKPVALAIPTSLAEALRLAADKAEEAERVTTQLAIAAPKAQTFDAHFADRKCDTVVTYARRRKRSSFCKNN